MLFVILDVAMGWAAQCGVDVLWLEVVARWGHKHVVNTLLGVNPPVLPPTLVASCY